MGAEAIEAIEKNFASGDARVAETVPDQPAEQEESAASVNDAEQETEQVEGDEHEEGEQPESSEKPKAKKKPGVHNRIGELTREKYEAKREADEWKAKFLAVQPQQPTPKQDEAPKGEPTLEDFDYDQSKYLAAMVQHQVEQRLKQAETEREQRKAQEQQQSVREAFNQRAQAFANDHEDFFDVTMGNQALPITDVMASYVMASENGPTVAYHLGKNPAEAQAIAAMPAYLAGAALARLEDRLTGPATPKTPAQPAQITRAPPVASRVSGAAPGTNPLESIEDHIAAVREKARR
jgi:hypothetical protein